MLRRKETSLGNKVLDTHSERSCKTFHVFLHSAQDSDLFNTAQPPRYSDLSAHNSLSINSSYPNPPTTFKMSMTTPTIDPSIEDMRERLQQLRRVERTKYQCADYIGDSYRSLNNILDDKMASNMIIRLREVRVTREQTLRKLYSWVGDLRNAADEDIRVDVDEAVLSTAAFIFDRYLSTFVPGYVAGEAGAPSQASVIGVASLFIAAKSQMPWFEFSRIEMFFGDYDGYARAIFAKNVELEILKAVNWDVVYPSPISIIRDLLTFLPGPLEKYKTDVLDLATFLMRLTTVTYGFITKFSPSTIALATLEIIFKNQCASLPRIALCDLVDATVHLSTMFKTYGMDLSFDNADVKQCREELILVLKKELHHGTIVATKRSCPSPDKVNEM